MLEYFLNIFVYCGILLTLTLSCILVTSKLEMIRFLAFNYALRMQRCMILMDKFFFSPQTYPLIRVHVHISDATSCAKEGIIKKLFMIFCCE